MFRVELGDDPARHAPARCDLHRERGRIQAPASTPAPARTFSAPSYSPGLGAHSLSASAQDVAGNTGSGTTSCTVGETFASLENLVAQFSTKAAAKSRNGAPQLRAFDNQVRVQMGKALTQARLLIDGAEALL